MEEAVLSDNGTVGRNQGLKLLLLFRIYILDSRLAQGTKVNFESCNRRGGTPR